MSRDQFGNGNYKGYYKKRATGVQDDTRWQQFSRDWFAGKTCIDVGCNEGQFTIQLAKELSPKSILGVDVDRRLIDGATAALKRLKFEYRAAASTQQQQQQQGMEASEDFISDSASVGMTDSEGATGGGGMDMDTSPPTSIASTSSSSSSSSLSSFNRAFMPRVLQVGVPSAAAAVSAIRPSMPTSLFHSSARLASNKGEYPYNVKFQTEDIMTSSRITTQQYDTIVCMSVVKWIHMNNGDTGLMEFFRKLYDMLAIGGRLILEYQPWKSYLNNKNVTEHIKGVFSTLTIRPEDFERILVGDVGFEIEHRLGTPLDCAKGFDRPILVLLRPVPQLAMWTTTTATIEASKAWMPLPAGGGVFGQGTAFSAGAFAFSSTSSSSSSASTSSASGAMGMAMDDTGDTEMSLGNEEHGQHHSKRKTYASDSDDDGDDGDHSDGTMFVAAHGKKARLVRSARRAVKREAKSDVAGSVDKTSW
jgi:7SK snRNA methylphosphate capping enzyme